MSLYCLLWHSSQSNIRAARCTNVTFDKCRQVIVHRPQHHQRPRDQHATVGTHRDILVWEDFFIRRKIYAGFRVKYACAYIKPDKVKAGYKALLHITWTV